MNKKITSSALAAVMVAGTTSFSAFAAMAPGTVVIGTKAYDISYANTAANFAEITNAIVAGGTVYVKGFDGKWINNATSAVVDASVIPAVTYKSAAGVVTAFDAKDMDVVSVPTVASVKAISPTQAVVTFATEIGTVEAANFTVDEDLTVVKAVVNADNKKEVTISFNQSMTDNNAYKVTVNGVKSVAGMELTADSSASFTYSIGDIGSITLAKSIFVTGDEIADELVVKNKNGVDVTDEYVYVISSTSPLVSNDEFGKIDTVTDSTIAYIQITVKDNSGDVVTTSDAIKVTLSATNVSSLVSFGLGVDVDNVTEYKAALKAKTLVADMKLAATPTLEILVNNNGTQELLATDNVTVTNLTPAIATVDASSGEFVVTAYAAGTAKVKLTVDGFTTTVSFTVKANAKITTATLSKTSVYFNTEIENAPSTVKVGLVDQYGDDFEAAIDLDGKVTVGTSNKGTLTVKSSNVNVATVAIGDDVDLDSDLPISITEIGKGTATITVTFKNTSGTVVFTKTLAVTAKEAGDLAGYVVTTDKTAIDLDKDIDDTDTEDDVVTFKVYEVDAAGNRIQQVSTDDVSLEVQGYVDEPDVADFIEVSGSKLQVVGDNESAYLQFAEAGTLKVNVLVNGTKVSTQSITYKNTDSVATTATINTSAVVIDNDKIDGANAALVISELFTGHYNTDTNKYTLAPKLTIKDQSSSVIEFATEDWTEATANVLVNDDVVIGETNTVTYTLTNISSNLEVVGGTVSLIDGKSSGTFTVVVSAVDTANVDDLLATPVSFTVTIVD